MGFSRQEYWSGFPYPPPGDLSNLEIEPVSLMSPALAGRVFFLFLFLFFFTTSTNWEARHLICAGLFLVAQSCLTLGTQKGKEFGKKVISLLSFPFQLMKA